MQVDLFEIVPCPQGRLATMARPRGGDWLEDEISSLKSQGVTGVVSLLTDEEISDLSLGSESDICERLGLSFFRYPISDRGLPREDDFGYFIARVSASLKTSSFLAIHCRAGIGRASITAAAILSSLGTPPTEGLRLISKARGLSIPDTDEQRSFILNLKRTEPVGPANAAKLHR